MIQQLKLDSSRCERSNLILNSFRIGKAFSSRLGRVTGFRESSDDRQVIDSDLGNFIRTRKGVARVCARGLKLRQEITGLGNDLSMRPLQIFQVVRDRFG